jgi:hypothetical protein
VPGGATGGLLAIAAARPGGASGGAERSAAHPATFAKRSGRPVRHPGYSHATGTSLFGLPAQLLQIPPGLPRLFGGSELPTAAANGLSWGALAAVLVFLGVQALVDRRDPKLLRAPQRSDDDSVAFR